MPCMKCHSCDSLLTQVDEFVEANGGGIVRIRSSADGPAFGRRAGNYGLGLGQLASAAALSEATLEIDEVPLVAVCRTCDNGLSAGAVLLSLPGVRRYRD